MTYPDAYFWSIAIGLTVILYVLRSAFILLQDRLRYSQTVKELLDFVAPAALAALTAPSLLFVNNTTYLLDWEKICAGSVAVVIAWWTKNIAFTIGAGIGVLWLIQNMM